MKVWDMMISGFKGTKYHKGILLEEFEEFILRLHEKLELYEVKLNGLTLRDHEKKRLVTQLIDDVNVLEGEQDG